VYFTKFISAFSIKEFPSMPVSLLSIQKLPTRILSPLLDLLNHDKVVSLRENLFVGEE
jgi:hypothetical protein